MTDSGPAQPAYGIGVLARRLGMAPATLRDWERRYGLGPTDRTAGGHRRYQATDVARIEHMRRLVLDGVPPAEAARVALAEPAPPDRAPALPDRAPAPSRPQAGSGSGGRSLALPGQLPQARGLARAALALDAAGIGRVLITALKEHGAVATWEQIAVPVLAAVGQRHELTGGCVEVEHVLSVQLQAVLAARSAQFAVPAVSRAVLLACTDDEQHTLALYALAAALAERGVRTLMLGARTPRAALADAIARTGPAAVLLWSQTAETASPGHFAGLPRRRPPLRLLVGGPGWTAVPPPGARLVSSLPDAVQQASEAVGAV